MASVARFSGFWIRASIIFIVIALGLRFFVVRSYRVTLTDMEPLLLQGDLVFSSVGEVKRGGLVIYKGAKLSVGKILAITGEQVEVSQQGRGSSSLLLPTDYLAVGKGWSGDSIQVIKKSQVLGIVRFVWFSIDWLSESGPVVRWSRIGHIF